MAKGTCQDVETRVISHENVCPDCFLQVHPTLIPRRPVDFDERFRRRWGFQLLHYKELNTKEEIEAMFERAEAFVAANFAPADRNSRYIFQSSERLNHDAARWLCRVLEMRLIPYVWSNVLAGQGSKVSMERRILILQMLEARNHDFEFMQLHENTISSNTVGQFRILIGAHSPWNTSVVENPPDDDCAIDRMPLRDETTVSLPCGHMFHKNCIEAYVDGVNCPYCRDNNARAPLLNISASETGPLPKWLHAIAPFERPRVDHELLSQPPPTDGEIDELRNALNLAQDHTRVSNREILRIRDVLATCREETRILEHALAMQIAEPPQDFDLDDENLKERIRQRYEANLQDRHEIWNLENAQRALISQVYEMNVEPHLYRDCQKQEWQIARLLYNLTRDRRIDSERLDDAYAKCFSWEQRVKLVTARKGAGKEDSSEDNLRLAEQAWRLNVSHRDKAADNLNFALYHKSLHELRK
ncbi:hypothetical protein EYC80_000794 [Monilinia laxa]|uniref:RING-type domain-containing protein n=1 Tax=Monilinia laxa TaxID=61186 RepID=A0A5N6K765_MONLA|nr:hypothetical protein EYC80_000794 [Monilinia laxa]